MSEQDLDVMRRWLDAWNNADLDTFADRQRHRDGPRWHKHQSLKQGNIVREQWYFDHAAGLKAVGLKD